MPAYGFYVLDPAGNTRDYLVKTCVTDQDARERAGHLLAEASGIEIWTGRRLVDQLAAAECAGVTVRP